MGEIKKKRFVVYVRCSTEDQSRGDYTTLDAQEDFCKSYLHSSQFEFVRTVRDDGHSAKNLARPGIRGILQEARLPESERTFDGVVFFKLDRLTRRMKDLYDLVDYFKDNNIEFISVAEKFDTSTPHGRAMLSLVGTFACLEREQLGERVKAAGIALTRQGRWTGGSVPHGYRLEHSGEIGRGGIERKKLVLDEKLAPKLRIIWELAAANKSLSFIAEELTRLKIPTSTGKPWRKQSIRALIHNPYFKGFVHYGPDEIHKGVHEPLVDPKLWEKANKVLSGNIPGHRFRKQPRKYIFLLEGLVRCGKCGSHMISVYSQGRSGEPYFYYECTLSRGSRICNCKRLSATQLDEAMVEFFSQASRDQRKIVAAIERSVRDTKKSLSNISKVVLEKEKELDSAREKIDRLMELGLRTSITDLKVFDEKMRSLDEEKNTLEQELRNLEAKKIASEVSADSAKFLHINIISVMARFKELSPEAQKALFQALIKEVIVYDDHLDIRMFVESESEQDYPLEITEKSKKPEGTKPLKPSKNKPFQCSTNGNSGSPVIKKGRGTTLPFFITGPEGKIFTRRKFFPKGQVLTPYGILKLCGTYISSNVATKRCM